MLPVNTIILLLLFDTRHKELFLDFCCLINGFSRFQNPLFQGSSLDTLLDVFWKSFFFAFISELFDLDFIKTGFRLHIQLAKKSFYLNVVLIYKTNSLHIEGSGVVNSECYTVVKLKIIKIWVFCKDQGTRIKGKEMALVWHEKAGNNNKGNTATRLK